MVFALDNSSNERGGDLIERHPCEPTYAVVVTQRVEHEIVAIEQVTFGGLPARLDRCKFRYVRGWSQDECEDSQHGQPCDRERTAEPPRGAPGHRAASTVTAAFGNSPSISGAYIASTRVAGRSNVPGLLSRTVYSTVQRPFGTN